MELRASNGDWARLRIAGYQFPELHDAPYDSNWLMVEGDVSLSEGRWSFQDACLLTYEAAALAHWLERHAAGGKVGDKLGFIEPNLSIRRVTEKAVRLYFALECQPPWGRSGDDWEQYFLEVETNEPMFLSAAHDLRGALGKFPQRTLE